MREGILRILVVSGLAFLLLVLGGFWFYKDQERQFLEKAAMELGVVTEFRAREIARWRKQCLAEATFMARALEMIEGVDVWVAEPRPPDTDRLAALFKRPGGGDLIHAEALVLDTEGRVRLGPGMEEGARHPELIPFVQKAFRERRALLTDLHVCAAFRHPHLAALAPLLPAEGPETEPLGVLVLMFDARTSLYPLLTPWPSPRGTAETLLVRREGGEALILSDLRFQRGAALSLRIPLERSDVPAVMAVLGKEGFVKGRSLRGGEVYAVIAPVPGSPWSLVTKMDEAEALQGLREKTLLLFGSLAALAASLFLLLRQWQRKAHYRALYLLETARCEEAARARESDAQYKLLAENIRDVVWQMDIPENRFLYVSPSVSRLRGYSPEEVMAVPVWEALTPGFREEVARRLVEDMEEIRRGEDPRMRPPLVVEQPCKDGGTVWTEVVVSYLCDAAGNPTRIVGLSRDITERRRAAEEIRRQKTVTEAINRLLQETLGCEEMEEVARVGLAIAEGLTGSRFGWAGEITPSGRLDTLAMSDTGYTVCGIGGDRTSRLRGMEVRGIWGRVLLDGKALVTNAPQEHPDRVGLPEGHPPLTAFLGVPILQQGRPVGMIALANKPGGYGPEDLEAVEALSVALGEAMNRRRAECERVRLIAAVEQANEAMVITDPEGTVQYVNPAFERLTGYGREEMKGQNPRVLRSGKQDRAFYEAFWGTITRGEVWTGRMVNRRKDGTLYTEESTISPVRDASGRIIHYIAFKRDVTEHLLLSAQLQQAQKMESVGRLAGGVAHDFNNMLSVVIGYTELALAGMAPDDPLRADLETIHEVAGRSTQIIRQLLAFARKQAVNPLVLDLNETVGAMSKMLRRLIGEDIDLLWIPGEGLWKVSMDPGQVDQVLANLCVNARDAIAGVGSVSIGTENVRFDEAFCREHPGAVKGPYVRLWVGDTGCGMSREVLDHLFEPFFTTKEAGKGTGMGLATVYGIVKQNRGFIYATSEPGRGTTIDVYLPSVEGEGTENPGRGEGEIPRGRGQRVLLVEDAPEILKVMETLLSSLGYTVSPALRPEEALGLVEASPRAFDLLITDVVMPGMDGMALWKRIQALRPGIPCLFMSGYTGDFLAAYEFEDMERRLIHKPFTLGELGKRVKEALEEAHAPEAGKGVHPDEEGTRRGLKP